MIVIKTIKRLLDKIDGQVIYGGGKDIIKPKKTGSRIIDFLTWLDFIVFSFLDRLDTRVIFRGKSVRTEKGRVRSRAEKKIVAFFEKHNIHYVYEPKLILDGVKLHPDFFLPEHGIYVEFWGMINESQRYRKTMQLKMSLYKKNNIPIVSLYPRHIKNLEKFFPLLCKKVMDRS